MLMALTHFNDNNYITVEVNDAIVYISPIIVDITEINDVITYVNDVTYFDDNNNAIVYHSGKLMIP